jgi:hypothetical protein
MSDAEYEAARRDAHACGLDFGKYVRQLLENNRVQDQPADLERRVKAQFERLRKLVPEIDPHDLHLILLSLAHPPSERRFFIRPHGGGFVF